MAPPHGAKRNSAEQGGRRPSRGGAAPARRSGTRKEGPRAGRGSIEVLPLRTRREDIPLLADYFRKKHADRLGISVRAISTAAIALLARHDWPGNVRELENVICRSLVLETTDVLQAATLPAELGPPSAAADAPAGPATPGTLADAERMAIAEALEKSGHNLTRAAGVLGIGRTTLYQKLKKHGLPQRPG